MLSGKLIAGLFRAKILAFYLSIPEKVRKTLRF
jgi:hypothetical protein